MSRLDDAEEIRRRLNEQIERVLDAFYPNWKKYRGKAYLTAKNNKDLGSFQVNLQGPRRGQWYRFSQKVGGGSVELISYALTNGTKAYDIAFREARSFLGMTLEESRRDDPEIQQRRQAEAEEAKVRRAAAEKKEEAKRARRAETAAEIWAECRPVAGTIAEEYLTARGLVSPPAGWPDDAIGFHPGLVYTLDEDRPTFPALVGKIVDIGGAVVAVHQIFIDPLTNSKITADPAKVTLGPMQGGAIRLGGIGEHINACEGLETGLGIWALTNFRNPVWPTLGTSGLGGLEIPVAVKRLTIWPDGDRPMRRDGQGGDYIPAVPAGRAAADKLMERAKRFGLRCAKAEEPSPGRDYLDIWNDQRMRA